MSLEQKPPIMNVLSNWMHFPSVSINLSSVLWISPDADASIVLHFPGGQTLVLAGSDARIVLEALRRDKIWGVPSK